MIRTIRNKQPDAILTSDWHLRERDANPVCRLDLYWDAQWGKVDFISTLQKKYDCPIFHGGDLFDNWKPSPNLLTETIKHIPHKFWTVYGQHDLPQHNLELAYKSGIYNLDTGGKIHVFDRLHWNQTPEDVASIILKDRSILVWHRMNWQGKHPWPGCTDPSAAKLLRQYPYFDLILTGDNHMPFVEEYEGRLLVNPGSIMRMDADQINHRPRVYLWYAETNTVEPVYIPINPAIDVISREHLEHKEQRDKRINAFIDRLDNDWKVELSFENNLKAFQQQNKVDEQVMDIIYKSLEV